jgi:hypothetical protein
MGNETGTRDSAKEELGWLKVVFAVAALVILVIGFMLIVREISAHDRRRK